MSLSTSPSPKPLSFLAFFATTFILFLLCASPASALAVPYAPARAKALAAVRDTTVEPTHSIPIAVPGTKNLPFELPPCEDEAACAEALWRAGSRVNAHAKEESTNDDVHKASGSSRGQNRNTALTEQLNARRRPGEAPEWSRIF
ncbi:hypothetical protein BKA80DRAFT_308163 [Phyllosticta citrichinensis]